MTDESAEAFKLHDCAGLLDQGIEIVFDNHFDEHKKSWRLNVCREATEEDLEENHHLEEVGELIWSTTVEIDCCPYCGNKLYEGNADKTNALKRRDHSDFSGWGVKKR